MMFLKSFLILDGDFPKSKEAKPGKPFFPFLSSHVSPATSNPTRDRWKGMELTPRASGEQRFVKAGRSCAAAKWDPTGPVGSRCICKWGYIMWSFSDSVWIHRDIIIIIITLDLGVSQNVTVIFTGWWCNNHLKKMSSSMGRIIPYTMENETCLKPPTSTTWYTIVMGYWYNGSPWSNCENKIRDIIPSQHFSHRPETIL